MGIPPPQPLDEELVTAPEFAYIAGVAPGTVDVWKNRFRDTEHPLPDPDDYVGDKPVWRLARVTAWLDATNRKYNVDGWRKERDAGGFRKTRGFARRD